MKYVNKFMRIFNFPFYFRGEVYDPFETVTLSEQSFDVLFEEYVKSFYDALERTSNKMTRTFIINKMENRISRDFDPTHYDIKARYEAHKDTLVELAQYLNVQLVKHQKLINIIETVLLMNQDTENAFKVNQFRKTLRHVKNVLLRRKIKIVLYMNLLIKKKMLIKERLFSRHLVVKIIVIVRNIYMNICKNTIQITIMFGHLKT